MLKNSKKTKIRINLSKNILIVTLVSFVNAISLAMIIPVLYVYGREFGLSEIEISLLLALFALAQFMATPIIGRLSDYYGRKPLLVISLFGTVLSNIMAFLAPTGAILLLARIFDGITGGNNSVAQAIISDSTEPEERAQAFGLFGAAFGMAFIIGPLLSIPLQSISTEAPFLGSAAIALLGTLITIFFLPETNTNPETEKLRLNNLGFGQIITGLRRDVVQEILILKFISALIFGVFQFGFQPYSVNVLGADSEGISIALVVFGIFSVISQAIVVPQLVARINYFKTLVAGSTLTSIALVIFLLPQDYTLFLMIIPLFAIPGNIFRPVLSALMSINATKKDQGLGMGLLESYFALATGIGPILGGIVAEVLGFSSPFILASLLALTTAAYAISQRENLTASTKTNF